MEENEDEDERALDYTDEALQNSQKDFNEISLECNVIHVHEKKYNLS